MKGLHILALAILPLVAASVPFRQLFDAETKTTLGLIFPPKSEGGDTTDDVIVKLTTSLPYGFVGFGFTAAGKRLPDFGLVGWVNVIKPPRALRRSQNNGPVSFLPNGLVAQQSVLAGETNAFTPSAGESGQGLVSLSPESIYDSAEDEVTFFFRCQQCSASEFKSGDSLTIFRSATSDLPLEDFTVTHIPVENIDIFRNDEFSSFAKDLGLA